MFYLSRQKITLTKVWVYVYIYMYSYEIIVIKHIRDISSRYELSRCRTSNE